MELTKEAIQLLLDTGREKQPQIIETPNKTFALLHNGSQVDITANYPPKRIQQRVDLLEAASFVEYVKRFRTPDTALFAEVTEKGATFRAVMDYHLCPISPDRVATPDYCSHTAVFATAETPEWKIWMGQDRKAMTQTAFATFVEDNMQLFQSPEGSGAPTATDLQELAMNLHGHTEARFNQAIRLRDGASKVSFEEDVDVKGAIAGQDMVLPAYILSGMPVLVGSANYMIRARLKTRISERKLVLFYETVNPYLIVRDAVKDAIKAIETGLECKAIIGSRA